MDLAKLTLGAFIGSFVQRQVEQRRVRQRLRAETDAPSGYWNRKQRQYALTLEEFAKDFTAMGHVKEATQIYLVLYGKTQPLAVAEGMREPSGVSPEEEARIRAEVEAMTDEELGLAAPGPADKNLTAEIYFAENVPVSAKY